MCCFVRLTVPVTKHFSGVGGCVQIFDKRSTGISLQHALFFGHSAVFGKDLGLVKKGNLHFIGIPNGPLLQQKRFENGNAEHTVPTSTLFKYFHYSSNLSTVIIAALGLVGALATMFVMRTDSIVSKQEDLRLMLEEAKHDLGGNLTETKHDLGGKLANLAEKFGNMENKFGAMESILRNPKKN